MKDLMQAIKAIPVREEFMSGQRTKYVQLDAVLALIEHAARTPDNVDQLAGVCTLPEAVATLVAFEVVA
jgi:hypothetical protein